LPEIIRLAVNHPSRTLLFGNAGTSAPQEVCHVGCRMVEPWRQERHCYGPLACFPTLPARIVASV
jgi:hypothetical protein